MYPGLCLKLIAGPFVVWGLADLQRYLKSTRKFVGRGGTATASTAETTENAEEAKYGGTATALNCNCTALQLHPPTLLPLAQGSEQRGDQARQPDECSGGCRLFLL